MVQKEARTILQAIRKGSVPTVVKRQASRGAVPVSTDEMLEILVLLSADPDATFSQQAQKTLGTWSETKLTETLANPDISTETLAAFAARDPLPDTLLRVILPHPNADQAVLGPLVARLPAEKVEALAAERDLLLRSATLVEALLAHTDLSDAARTALEEVRQTLEKQRAEAPAPEAKARVETEPEPEDDRERVSLTVKVARMSVSERVQCALKGSKDERMILIRDPSKVVYRAVLQSPKLGDSEVEGYATMKNVAEEVLRLIANSRKFMKSYVVVKNLVNNPRTPLDVSLTLLNRLTDTDLRFLTRNRNIPETLRTMAVRLSKQRSGK